MIRTGPTALVLAAVLVVTSCKPKDSFHVQVVTVDGKPVSSARLSVGFDRVFTGTTDDDGFVYVPNWASGDTAVVTKTNFRSMRAEISPDAQVTLTPMPESLRLVGMAEGNAVLFGPETLATVTSDGHYRVYTYSDTRITEVATLQLPQPVRHQCVFGDTLWYATYDSGMYAYSLSNRLNPVKLMHVDIGGVLDPFVVIDTFIVMSNVSSAGTLRIFSYGPDGSTELVSSFDSLMAGQVAVVSHYVVALGLHDMPVIYDIADIRNPRQVYHGIQPQYWSGFLCDNRVVMNGFDTLSGRDTSCYGVVDLTDPSHPVQTGPFPTDSWLDDILNDSMAVGEYNLFGISILRGTITGGFHSVALVQAEPNFHGYPLQGFHPPYYVLFGSLWKLVSPGTE